jgi:hypothetical protein
VSSIHEPPAEREACQIRRGSAEAGAMLGGRSRRPAVNLLVPDISIAEKVLRSVVVYAFRLVAFRLCGKRQLGQLTAFDLVVLLPAS